MRRRITPTARDWSSKTLRDRFIQKGEETNAANGNGDMTKADMQDCLDQVQDILTDAYTPEASREDLAAAIGNALDVLEGNAPEDDTDADDTDDDGDVG